ncbi:MAG: glycosyl hydrolase [Acutalibacteraceae bacterium]
MEICVTKSTPTKEFNHHWKFCVGSAHAAYALRHDYTTQLARLHKDLGIERVRFHGIFDDCMHTLTKAKDIMPIPFGRAYTEQSFRQCAVAYDNIISAGMKPFVELSFMPRHLAKSKSAKGAFFYKPIVCMPKALEAWQAYIKSFINFLIERYGLEEIRTWYFEVWNEPDLPVVFFYGNQKDYFKLYSATVRAIKEVDGKIKVGGPSTSGSKWIKEFLDYCKATNTPVDFVSTHQYSGDPIGGIENSESGISIKANMFAGLKERNSLNHNNILDLFRSFNGVNGVSQAFKKNALTESAKNIKKLVGNLPLFYTEWNLCASFSAPYNDTSMQAAYVLHTIFGSQESITGSSIWCFSDLFEEFHQFPEEFHGGFGLMTQSGIKKPTYRALQFLNEAGNTVYDIPANDNADAAVFKKGSETHIIISKLGFKDLSETENVTVKIETDKPEKIVLNRIDGSHCNPLKAWEAMGKPQVPTPSQLEKIKCESETVDENVEFEYADGCVEIHTTVAANEIKRIVIK